MGAEDTSLGEAVLVLTTDNNGFRMGIDDAQMAANAMQRRLDEMQNHIKDRFAEKFEHVGVHLFGMDMLRTIGITEGARPILGAMMLGVNTLADSFGAAAGPLGLLVMGMTALAAIGWKVHESHEKHAESLEKLTKSADDTLKSTDDLKRGLEEYNTTLKGVTPELDHLYDATVKLDRIERQRAAHMHGEAMASAQEDQVLLEKKSQGIHRDIEDLKKLDGTYDQASGTIAHYGDRIVELNKQLDENSFKIAEAKKKYEENKAAVDALAGGFQNLADKEKLSEEAAKKHDEIVRKAAEEYRKSEAAVVRLGTITRTMEQDGAEATATAYDKKLAQIEKYRIAKQAEIENLHKEALASATTNTQIMAANRQYADASIALSNAVTQKMRANFDITAEVGIGAANHLAAGFADSFSKSIVEGKNFEDSMKNVFKSVAEEAIAQLIRIAIQAQITKMAVGGIFAGGAGVPAGMPGFP